MESDFADFKKIGIIGVGQIGGSIALALRKRMKGIKIYGCDTDSRILEKARFLDFKTTRFQEILKCKILIIATPVLEIIKTLEELERMKYKGIVIDTGSTKKIICERAKNLNLKFTGGHPLAGNEKTAPYAWDENLFENKMFFLCDVRGDKKLIEFSENFVRKIGAIPLLIEPEYHDRMLALTSHLPYLISFLFLKNSRNKNFEGPGFKSFTRIANQNPEMFADVILTNRYNIIKNFENIKNKIVEILKIDKREKLLEVLNENKKT